jgi:nucleoside-diphosphate-sugar epimerase
MSDRRTTLVTGGAGYVGSVLVPELVESGRRVRVLDSLLHDVVPDSIANGGEAIELVRGDVRDAEQRRTALAGVDEVVHLAAIVGDPACSREPDEARSVNLGATERLVREAREAGVQRFVFASTCSNYGKLDADELATEEWDLNPVSLYAETKVAAELDILEQSGNGFSATCLRLATVYGASPRMRFDLTVNEFTRDVVLGRELVVYGEQFWRPYVHVRDAARGMRLVLDSEAGLVGAKVFNLGDTRENYRKLDLVELLRARVPGANVSFVHRDEDPRDYRVSFGKIGETLGFTISMRVPDGIDEVADLVSSGAVADPFAPVYRN